MFEIFVYSTRFEGVHLRGGTRRARRPALVGPAGGLPHRGARPGEGADGEEHRDRAGRLQGRLRAQARAAGERPRCLHEGRRGLLPGLPARPARHHRQPGRRQRSCRRRRCVRHDDDDPYLVVAADKGTATFSDYANGISAEYGFWLGDAFASGGSVGYDHKAHGHHRARRVGDRSSATSARWASTRRRTDFTVVGVGDMSGDVFGNGMLLSRAHPAGGGVRPPPHLPRPEARRGDVASPSASACSSCRARRGPTTTRS